MAERIIVTDPKLKAREEAAIADLRALAPDGVIDGLDSKDKSLGKRLSKLYPRLGYETRKDMIEAFGFTLASKGGRRPEVDPVQYLKKLVELYPQGTSCSSLNDFSDLLKKEHPEMASKLKTIRNGSQSAFGSSFLNVLKEHGLVGERAGFDADACEAALEALTQRYAGTEDVPCSMGELFDRNPDLGVSRRELALYVNERSGTKLAAYLKELGLLRSTEKASESDNGDLALQLEGIAKDIARRQADLMLADRPKSIKVLFEEYPEYAAVLKKARAKRLLTQEYAIEHEMIRPRGVYKKPRFKRCVLNSVRNAHVDELLKVWRASGLPLRIDRDSEKAWWLASDISCIDVDARTQDQETLYSRCLESPQNPQSALEEFMKELADIAGSDRCELISTQKQDGYVLWQVRVTKTEPLSAGTLVYGLRKAEKLTAGDLGLSDSWRIRYADVLESA